MYAKLNPQRKSTVKQGTMGFIYFLLSAQFLLIVSPSISAQENRFPARSLDKDFYESGGDDGEVCLHVSSSVAGQPHLLNLERKAYLEVEVRNSEVGFNRDFIQAIDYSLEMYGFVKTGEDIYELPNSSLCFLKIYWDESGTTVRLTQYYRGSPQRENMSFDKWYDPEDLAALLNQVFVERSMAEFASAYNQLLLIHYPIRSLPQPVPQDMP